MAVRQEHIEKAIALARAFGATRLDLVPLSCWMTCDRCPPRTESWGRA